MTLIMRLSRLFKADVHGILDHLEDPEAILQQAIRDMEDEIEHGEADLATCRRREAKQHATVSQLHDTMIHLTEQIEICFEAENESLAKAVIRKKLEAEIRLQQAIQIATDLTASKESQQCQLDAQKAQLQAIIDSIQPFMGDASPSTRCASSGPTSPQSTTVSDEDVEIAFIREQRQRAERKEI